MQPELVGGLLRVWVVVYGPAGSAAVSAALDTGASYLLISSGLASKLGYDLSQAGRYRTMDTVSGSERAPLVTLNATSLAGHRIPSIEALCYDLPRRMGVQALIGLSVLRHFDVDLHFRSGRFEIRRP